MSPYKLQGEVQNEYMAHNIICNTLKRLCQDNIMVLARRPGG